MPKTTFLIEPGKHEILMTRVFDAPRDRVFKAYTDPSAIPHWWGPKDLTTTVDQMDVRHGGVWRFVSRDPAGNEYAFRGVYHEASPPDRLISTFEFEPMPGHVSLETATFEEREGKTTLTARSVFQTVEDRDLALQAGMQEGAAESMDRLAALVEQA